jgi:hypothetical protein
LCLVTILLPGEPASAATVKVEYDDRADFSSIRRYQWRTHAVFEKNPELREVYATGIQLVMQAGNEQLSKRGLTPVDDSPDVFITFFLHAKGGEEVRVIDGGYGWYGAPAWSTTEIDRYLDGTLVIDIVDAKSSKLVWRAFCGTKIDDFSNRHKEISDVVKKALQKFPPKRK